MSRHSDEGITIIVDIDIACKECLLKWCIVSLFECFNWWGEHRGKCYFIIKSKSVKSVINKSLFPYIFSKPPPIKYAFCWL